MRRQAATTINVDTSGRGLFEITSDVSSRLAATEIGTGLLTLFLRHMSASLLIQENADPDVRADLERFFSRLVPDGDPLFQHRDEGPDDIPAHARSTDGGAIVGTRQQGGLVLSTWQGIYV